MRRKSLKTELIRTGMGCFVFGCGVSALNMLLLPFARACYNQEVLPIWGWCALALALFLLAGFGLARAREESVCRVLRVARPAFLLALLIIQIALGYWMAYTSIGDSYMLLRGAQLYAKEGCFDAEPGFGLYFARFSNQWGFLLMLIQLFRLLEPLGSEGSLFALNVIQALLYTVAMRAALSLSRRVGKARGEMLMLFMLAVCFPLYLAAAVLYTDTFSLPFVVLTLFFAQRVMDAKTPRAQLAYALLCALMATLGGQIKMTVAIVLIAACICWLLTLPLARAALLSLLCVAVMAGGTAFLHRAVLADVVDDQVYAQQRMPAIHWVMMSIPTSQNPYGSYSGGDYGRTWRMMDEGASRAEIMDSIFERMKDRVYTLRYPNRLVLAALRKNASFVGDGTFGMTEMLDDYPVRENVVSSYVLEGRPHYRAYSALCTGIWGAHLLLSCIGCALAIRRYDLRTALLCVALFGLMLFLMIWETRSRYFFGFMPVMLLLSCAGVMGLTEPAVRGNKEGPLPAEATTEDGLKED